MSLITEYRIPKLNGYERIIEPPALPALHRVLEVKITARGNSIFLNMKRMVAHGFFGEVWYAKTEDLKDHKKKKIAVKRFSNNYDRELLVIYNLMLDKPSGIPRLHGIMRETLTDAPYVVMKFCNKGTAHDFFVKHVNDKKACYRLLILMMQAVQSFHDAGYCHRDIHERNFLLHKSKKNKQKQVFLSDFGHATKIKGTITPLRRRVLYLINSPPKIKEIFKEAESRKNYVEYGHFSDVHGFEIDGYQLGMMIFRVAVSSVHLPLVPGLRNQLQHELVEVIDHTPDLYKYLKQEHSEIPKAVVKVIAGLLTAGTPLPIPQAIETLNHFVNPKPSGRDATL